MTAIWAGTPSLRRKTCSATCANEFWSFFKRKQRKYGFLIKISGFETKKTTSQQHLTVLDKNIQILPKSVRIQVPDIKSHLDDRILAPSFREGITGSADCRYRAHLVVTNGFYMKTHAGINSELLSLRNGKSSRELLSRVDQ